MRGVLIQVDHHLGILASFFQMNSCRLYTQFGGLISQVPIIVLFGDSPHFRRRRSQLLAYNHKTTVGMSENRRTTDIIRGLKPHFFRGFQWTSFLEFIPRLRTNPDHLVVYISRYIVIPMYTHISYNMYIYIYIYTCMLNIYHIYIYHIYIYMLYIYVIYIYIYVKYI